MLLQYAAVSTDSGLRSQQFGDIYYNPEAGRQETEHVFIRGCVLRERLEALPAGGSFTIGETGFGTGLNFIAAASTFLNHAPAGAHLSYISCEQYPLPLPLLQNIQQHWELPDLRQNLYRQYPHNHAGFHLLKLHPQISLLLLLGDANHTLPELRASADAWFLDGFAPSKNQSLWSSTVLNAIAANSKPNAAIATFSAARSVKDGLTAAGFTLTKTKGYGRKRDMLTGIYTGRPRLPHWTDQPQPLPKTASIAVIGAGLAGASTARALHQAGCCVSVYHQPDSHPPASAVPAAVPYLQPGITDTPMRRYHLACWHHLLRQNHPEHTLEKAPIHLSLPAKRTAALLEQQLLNSQEWTAGSTGLTLHRAGIYHTPALLKHLLTGIPLHTQTITTQHIQEQRISGRAYDAIILCTAQHTALLPQPWHQQLSPLRGQALIMHSKQPPPQGAYCAGTSIFSYSQDQIYTGSAYQPNCSDSSIRPQETQQLYSAYRQHFPEYPAGITENFAAIRASTRDYLPLTGALPESQSLQTAYAKWRKNAALPIHASPAYPQHLYLNAGYGSKGSLCVWLNADILTAIISGRPLPLPHSLFAGLSPARTIIKSLIRNTDKPAQP